MGLESLFVVLVHALLVSAISYGVSLAVQALTGGSKVPSVSSSSSASIDIMGSLATLFDANAPFRGTFGRRRIGGTVIFADKVGSVTYFIYVLGGAPIKNLYGVYIDNKLVSFPAFDGNGSGGGITSAPWQAGGKSSISMWYHDGTQTAASSVLLAAFPSTWLPSNIGPGIPYVVIKCDPDPVSTFQAAYSRGFPDTTFDVEGHAVFDPRDPTQSISDPATWGTSSNPVIHMANYIIHDLGMGLPISYVNWESAAARATDADINFYRCAATWKTGTKHEEVLTEIGACCAGGIIPTSGAFKFWVGQYDEPASNAHITVDDYLDTGLTFSNAVSIDAKVNGVRGVFSSSIENWEERDFPPFQDLAAVAIDGREIWGDIKLPFVYDNEQAQRLAKISFMITRYGTPASVKTRFDLIDTISGDMVSITDAQAGFSAKTYRVLKDAVGSDLSIDFTLRHEDASFYAFDRDVELKPYTPTLDASSNGVRIPSPGIKIDLSNRQPVTNSAGTVLYYSYTATFTITAPVVTDGIMGSANARLSDVNAFAPSAATPGSLPVNQFYLGSVRGPSSSFTYTVQDDRSYQFSAEFLLSEQAGQLSTISITPSAAMASVSIPPSPEPPLFSSATDYTITGVADATVDVIEVYTSPSTDFVTATLAEVSANPPTGAVRSTTANYVWMASKRSSTGVRSTIIGPYQH